MTLELLDRMAHIFDDYFHGLNEEVIKDNFVTCYQVFATIYNTQYTIGYYTSQRSLHSVPSYHSLVRGTRLRRCSMVWCSAVLCFACPSCLKSLSTTVSR